MPSKNNKPKISEVPTTTNELIPMVKLVVIKYGRKINLETISPRRPYENAEAEVSLFADIDPLEQGNLDILEKCQDALQTLVRNRVTAILQETVTSVRAADQSLKYSSIVILQAFDEVSKNWISDEQSREKERALFLDKLNTMQANIQSV